jgi:hypothetical protein
MWCPVLHHRQPSYCCLVASTDPIIEFIDLWISFWSIDFWNCDGTRLDQTQRWRKLFCTAPLLDSNSRMSSYTWGFQAQPELCPGAYEDSQMLDGQPLNPVEWMEPGQANLHPASLLSRSMTCSCHVMQWSNIAVVTMHLDFWVLFYPKPSSSDCQMMIIFFDRYKDIRMVTTNLTPHHDAKLVNIQYIIFTTYYIDLYRHDHHYPICAGQSDWPLQCLASQSASMKRGWNSWRHAGNQSQWKSQKWSKQIKVGDFVVDL